MTNEWNKRNKAKVFVIRPSPTYRPHKGLNQTIGTGQSERKQSAKDVFPSAHQLVLEWSKGCEGVWKDIKAIYLY